MGRRPAFVLFGVGAVNPRSWWRATVGEAGGSSGIDDAFVVRVSDSAGASPSYPRRGKELAHVVEERYFEIGGLQPQFRSRGWPDLHIGVITTDNISEYLMVRAAQRGAEG